jgi:ubiquinone/menaquinone biosynthesis C-methylase UbiE
MDGYDKTKEFFSKNSQNYARSQSHAKDDDLNILMDMLSLNKEMTGLDTATGAGFTAINMAKRISKVYALDMVENMLSETMKLSERNGLNNIIPVKGYVDSMPFGDEKFNVVTCRRAAHHFSDKNKFARESYRVLKRGGKIGIDDMTVPDNIINYLNEFERIRDHSHMYAASPENWESILKNVGFADIKYKVYRRKMDFEQWVYPVNKDSIEGKKSLEYLKNANSDFISGINWDGKSFTKSWIVIIGTKSQD